MDNLLHHAPSLQAHVDLHLARPGHVDDATFLAFNRNLKKSLLEFRLFNKRVALQKRELLGFENGNANAPEASQLNH